MNSLEEADVEVYELNDYEPLHDVNRESGASATATISNLLQGICNVKSLHLSFNQRETLIPMPPKPMLGFHKLVELELEVVEYFHPRQGMWVIQLLCCAPNLDSLHFNLPVEPKGFEPLSLPKEVPSCLVFQLKEIKIRYFEGNEQMFEMISYFLKHGSVLDVLKVGIKEDYSNPSTLRNVIKLLGLPRNSKKCRVVIYA